MEATKKNIYIEGFESTDDAEVVFDWQVTLEEEDGTPMINLDTATSTFKIKRSYSDATALLEASVGDGITIDTVESTIRIKLTVGHFDNFALDIEEQEFLYDWDLTDDINRKYRLYKGTVTLGGDIS